MKKIGWLVIGTNKYFALAEQCINQIKKHVKIPGYDVVPHLFTNQHPKSSKLSCDYKHLYIDHMPWPLITLLRYHNFLRYEQDLRECDYLFYIDADLKIVQDIGDDILGDLVATQHPGFFDKPRAYWTYENRPELNSYIPYNMGKQYVVGSYQGGSTDSYLKACKTMVEWINQDLGNRLLSVWDDESYWNKYCLLNPPSKILLPNYCCPENWPHIPATFGPPKIVALDKNHNEIRKES